MRQRLHSSRFGMLVALNAQGVVLGQLRHDALDASDRATVDQLMREGPTTIRPSEELEPLVQRMRNANSDGVLVTRSDGTLIGILERSKAEQSLSEG